MLIKIRKIENRRILILSCDAKDCSVQFERGYSKRISEKQHHFCSNDCVTRSQKHGGVLYAVSNESIERTCLKRYGVRRPLQKQEFLEKMSHTCQEKFGTNFPLQSGDCKEKAKQTLRKNYGVDWCTKSSVIKEKIKRTNSERYGSEWPAQSDIVQEKRKVLAFERYGVEHWMQTDKAKLLFAEKRDQITEKRFSTLKKNGMLKKSRLEDDFFDLLVSHFGCDDVQRWIRINGWSIDFYVKSIDTFVQFDGVFWHGLDRTEEQLKNSIRRIDSTIMRTRQRDEKQIQWFEQNQKRLIRITDIEFRHGRCDELIQRLSKYQSGPA